MNAVGWAARQFVRLASDPIPTARPSPTPTPTVLLTPPTPRPTFIPPGSTSTSTATPASGQVANQQQLLATPEATVTASNDAGAADPDSTPVAGLEPLVSSTAEVDNTNGTTKVVIVTDGARLMVRSAPDPEAEIVARVLNGESYSAIGATDDGQWTQIIVESSGSDTGAGSDIEVSGWVSTRFTQSTDN